MKTGRQVLREKWYEIIPLTLTASFVGVFLFGLLLGKDPGSASIHGITGAIAGLITGVVYLYFFLGRGVIR